MCAGGGGRGGGGGADGVQAVVLRLPVPVMVVHPTATEGRVAHLKSATAPVDGPRDPRGVRKGC